MSREDLVGAVVRAARANAARDATAHALGARRLDLVTVRGLIPQALELTFSPPRQNGNGYRPPRYHDVPEWVKNRVATHVRAISELIVEAVVSVVEEKTPSNVYANMYQHVGMRRVAAQIAERCMHIDKCPESDTDGCVTIAESTFVVVYHAVFLAYAEASRGELAAWDEFKEKQTLYYTQNPHRITPELRDPSSRVVSRRPPTAKNYNQQAHKTGLLVLRWMLLWATTMCGNHHVAKSWFTLGMAFKDSPDLESERAPIRKLCSEYAILEYWHRFTASCECEGAHVDEEAQQLLALWRLQLLAAGRPSVKQVHQKRFPQESAMDSVSQVKRAEAGRYLTSFEKRNVANQLLSDMKLLARSDGFSPTSASASGILEVRYDALCFEQLAIESEIDKPALEPASIAADERGKLRESFKPTQEAFAYDLLFEHFRRSLRLLFIVSSLNSKRGPTRRARRTVEKPNPAEAVTSRLCPTSTRSLQGVQSGTQLMRDKDAPMHVLPEPSIDNPPIEPNAELRLAEDAFYAAERKCADRSYARAAQEALARASLLPASPGTPTDLDSMAVSSDEEEEEAAEVATEYTWGADGGSVLRRGRLPDRDSNELGANEAGEDEDATESGPRVEGQLSIAGIPSWVTGPKVNIDRHLVGGRSRAELCSQQRRMANPVVQPLPLENGLPFDAQGVQESLQSPVGSPVSTSRSALSRSAESIQGPIPIAANQGTVAGHSDNTSEELIRSMGIDEEAAWEPIKYARIATGLAPMYHFASPSTSRPRPMPSEPPRRKRDIATKLVKRTFHRRSDR